MSRLAPFAEIHELALQRVTLKLFEEERSAANLEAQVAGRQTVPRKQVSANP